MRCTLVSFTQEADALLIFAKSTRLNMSPSLLDEIRGWPQERKAAELAYIANSIPSSWEIIDYHFMLEKVSRAFTHQLVRSRHGSFAQQSLRVVDASEFEFVMPASLEPSFPGLVGNRERVANAVQDIREAYGRLIEKGASPEEARSILPTNVATNILAKFNLRTLSELCRSRVGARVQDEYREVVAAMREAVLQVHPWAEPFLTPRQAGVAAEIDAWALANVPAGESRRDLLKIADRLRQER